MTSGSALAVAATAVFAGVLGSMLGLGGGFVIVPLLSIALGLPIHVAVGTGLIAVVANALSASAVQVASGAVNLRLALALSTVTTAGALVGGLVGTSLSGSWLFGLFGALLAAISVLMLVRPEGVAVVPPSGGRAGPDEPPAPGGPASVEHRDFGMAGRFFDSVSGSVVSYQPRRVGTGTALSFVAGVVSGTLGVGGGIIQVPVMNLMLGVPMKAATATSSYIISLTAMAGAVVYMARGFINPMITALTVIGVYVGARAGTRFVERLPSSFLRRAFSVILIYMASRMFGAAFNLPV